MTRVSGRNPPSVQTHFFGPMMATAVGVAIGALTTVVAPRMLGVTEFGKLSWGLTLIYIVAAGGTLGLPLALTALSGHRDEVRGRHQLLLSAATALVFAASTLAAVGAAIACWRLPTLFGREVASVGWVAAFGIVPTALLAVLSAGLRANGQFGRAAFTSDLSSRLCVLIGLVTAALLGSRSADAVMWVIAGSLWVAVVIARAWAPSHWRAEPRAVRTMVDRSLPFFAGSMAATLIPQGGVVILGSVKGAESVASLSLAIRVMLVCSLGSIAGSRLIGPLVARSTESSERIQVLMRSTATAALWITIALSAPFIVGGYWLVPLVFGEKFRAAWLPTGVLLVALVYSAFAGFAGQLLYHRGYQHRQSRRTTIGACCFVVASVPAARFAGATGVSITAAVVLMTLNELQARHVWRETRISTRAELSPRRVRPALDALSRSADGTVA